MKMIGYDTHGRQQPGEWDETEYEPERELSFSHYDLYGEDPVKDCCGQFFVRTIEIPGTDRVFECYCCDECRELRTKEELIEKATEAYGKEWEERCTNDMVIDRDTNDWEFDMRYEGDY